MKPVIPTYNLEQINETHFSQKDVFFTDARLHTLKSILNKPYRSNYYGLGLCISGTATLISDLESNPVKPNSIITMSPQVVKQWGNISSDFETLSIFFTKGFFTKIFSNQNYVEQFNFFDQHTKHVCLFAPNETIIIHDIFKQIKSYINQNHPYENDILVSYINILLFEYQALYDKQYTKLNIQQTRNQQIVEAFKKLINSNFQTEKTVKFYADKLFITAKYLTEILKQETGKTASEWINEIIILEAKILLSNPALQISQIADTLNFPDASSFGKFFKSHTGTSPIQYRKSL